jgi:hypothetical protein
MYSFLSISNKNQNFIAKLQKQRRADPPMKIQQQEVAPILVNTDQFGLKRHQ